MLINPGPLQWLITLLIIGILHSKFYILILNQLYHKPIISYVNHMFGMQYSVYVEISRFWQCQAVWSSDTYEQSLISVQVPKTRHVYTSQWKSQVNNLIYCLQMGTTQGPLWQSCLVQTSQWEIEWHVSNHTRENTNYWFPNVWMCKPSPSF
jgi:hypothetical protein